MLHKLSASDPRFKQVTFRRGLNLVVARRDDESTSQDSRNGAGKSSLIELLHFLLGSSFGRNHLLNHKELRNTTFTLGLDWPSLERRLEVSRSGSNASVVSTSPCLDQDDAIFPSDGCPISLSRWQRLIETKLFGLTNTYPGVSGRGIFSFLMRRVSDHAFNEATRSFPKQPESQSSAILAYMLGLDAELASKYQELSARRTARNQLKKAASDPALGQVVGKVADLRAEMAITEARISELERQIATFNVIPQYEQLKEDADQLSERIRELGTRDVIDQRNLDHLLLAIEESADPEVRYLEQVYKEANILLPREIRKRFDEVSEFHSAVVANRRLFLEREISNARSRLEERKRERAIIGAQLSEVLRDLDQGGALTSLTSLQRALGQTEATYRSLKHRLEAAQTIESSGREIETAKLELVDALETDLMERQGIVNESNLFFNELVQRLYGTRRHSYLRIEPGASSLKIEPKINSDLSSGIGKMAIFCFDLTVAIGAHRRGRGPDFLVHDSPMFDGVDDRQLSRALEVAGEIMDREQMQYIVTINEDDLAKAERLGFDPGPYTIDPHLSDEYENGGLFGFRFDS